jgi:hypothetical protein
LGNLSKDTTEMDLWAFDDDLDSLDEPQVPDGAGVRAADQPRPAGRIVPTPREFQGKSAAREIDERPASGVPAAREELIRRNVEKIRSTIRPAAPAPSTAGQAEPEGDFDDLDEWEDAAPQPETDGPVSDARPEPEDQVGSAGGKHLPEDIGEFAPGPERNRAENEFGSIPNPDAQPVSLRPHLGLTAVEKIGLAVLIMILLGAAASILVYSLNRLPTESLSDHEIDYPVKGSHLSVNSATTYWRKPIREGPNPDTVRRDTELLPVLELDITGGPATIRVLFRNDERAVVGDAVTRAVTGSGTLKIPATAGFEDYGMYAAYTTGRGEPWTIEIYEAKAGSASGDDFKKLLELNISIDRR